MSKLKFKDFIEEKYPNTSNYYNKELKHFEEGIKHTRR